LKCQASFDDTQESCPSCGERVTHFQKTYSTRLIDGKYQIIQRLGVGGMGEIFLVRHIHLNEERVIKVMRPNIASDDQSLQRFLQEARTSTMVKHRNLAMLYDFSTLEDGSYYMVWEFIDGTDIQKWVTTNGPLSPAFATEISIHALTGLEHLHSMGLIHRDISPENIMLAADHHGRLLPKVIDFGIAKQLSEGEGGQGLTQTGMFVGKLKYASPEQAGFLKEGEHIDARSDLYSFGVVLYEMLAGRAPFLATNPQGYILKHVTEKPAPILEINPNVNVHATLEKIVFKALEKDRNDRYKSAGEMVNALEEVAAELGESEEAGTFGKRLETMPGRSSADAARKAATLAGTVPGRAGTGGTMAGGGGATIVDRVQTGGGDQATIVEAVPGMGGGEQATVVERIGGGASQGTMGSASAAATVVESKMSYGGGGSADATVVERQMTMPGPPAASKAPLFIGLAVVAIIAIIAAVVFLRPKPEPGTQTTTTTTVPGAKGFLLVASPFGETVSVENTADNSRVTLPDNVAPLRASLPPGNYRVTLDAGGGKVETHDVTLEAGKESRTIYSRIEVDLDQAVEAVLNP
jgi:serine/threonine-protein kinase